MAFPHCPFKVKCLAKMWLFLVYFDQMKLIAPYTAEQNNNETCVIQTEQHDCKSERPQCSWCVLGWCTVCHSGQPQAFGLWALPVLCALVTEQVKLSCLGCLLELHKSKKKQDLLTFYLSVRVGWLLNSTNAFLPPDGSWLLNSLLVPGSRKSLIFKSMMWCKVET